MYDFELVLDIHHTIIQVITEMDNYLSSKKEELRDDKTRSDNGLNIENFIHAFIYKNTLLESQIQLFINYMTVFHKYHGKYLRRFRLKLMFMYKQIDSDVDLEQSGLNKDFLNKKTSEEGIVQKKQFWKILKELFPRLEAALLSIGITPQN